MAQGQMYAVSFLGVASPAAIWDAFELNTSSSAITRIHAVYLGEISDFGDAQAEQLTVQLIKGYTTTGSGGSTATPVPKSTKFAAAGLTSKTNNTTVASAGTPLVMHAGVWNEAMEWQYRPTPEERDDLAPSTRVVLRVSAPADTITCTCTIIFEEIG